MQGGGRTGSAAAAYLDSFSLNDGLGLITWRLGIGSMTKRPGARPCKGKAEEGTTRASALSLQTRAKVNVQNKSSVHSAVLL